MHWFQRLLSSVLRTGPIPQHLAIIMDGNRRYALKHSMPSLRGHTQGYDKLLELLEWARYLGIHTVTVFAFSLDNFARPSNEIAYLMTLFKEKFQSLIEHRDLVTKHSICVKVLGDTDRLPPDVRQCINEIVALTKDNNRLYLNIAMAYTSQAEVTHSADRILSLMDTDTDSADPITAADIDGFLLTAALYTASLPKPTPCLLLRTSGETRLSDFMLYQSTTSQLSFVDVYWPELSFYQFLHVILHYQRSHADTVTAQQLFERTINKRAENDKQSDSGSESPSESEGERRARLERALATVPSHAGV